MLNNQLDQLDKKILQLISEDARIPFLEVARECNVSGAAIHQRIQKLKNIGVIKGSEFVIDTHKVGYETCAYVGITLSDVRLLNSVVDELKKVPEVVECHFATGKFTIFVKIYARDNSHLLHIIIDNLALINGIAHTETFQISLEEIFRRQLSIFDVDAPNGED
jgi:Lrp/AsnC family transcriptional regulator for asnA, asnC and gidA